MVFGCTTVNDIYYQPKSTEIQQPKPNNNLAKKNNLGSRDSDKKKDLMAKFSGNKPVKIALLVPLSGKNKELGQNMLDSAQLALFGIGDTNLILLPIDTKDGSQAAIEAANIAVKNNAKIILGPIFSNATKAIAPIARENNISVVSFSNDKELAYNGVFVMGFRPEQQVRRIVEFAMEKGIEDFAAILPSNAYGAVASKEMRESLSKNDKASVLQAEIYITDKSGVPQKLESHVDSVFNALITNVSPKSFLKEPDSQSEAIKFPRALLAPQGGKQLAMITQLLSQYNHDPRKIKLLGISNWYEDDILNNPALQGSWFAAPPQERRRLFESKFKEIYGYEPNEIASLAYDGIALTATIAKMTDGTKFSPQEVSNQRGFVGIDGIFRFNKDGLIERGLEVVEISGGQYNVVSPAPEAFFEATIDRQNTSNY